MKKQVSKQWLILFGLVALIPILHVSCGGGGGGTLNGKTISNYTVTSTGDKLTSATLGISDDGNLRATLAPILDGAGAPYGEDDASKMSVDGSASTARLKVSKMYLQSDGDATCDASIEFGGGSDSSADIAFLVDTTGSMGPAVTGISDSISQFAQDLTDAGIDAQFAFATFGDAWSTKFSSGSAYTLGTGTDTPPTFDPIERPLIDFTGLTDFQAFVEEVKTNVGSGADGGNTTENYYGVAAAMAGKLADNTGLTRRSGVPFYEVLVGDACSHTAEAISEAYADISGKWVPPSRDDLSSLLGDGSVTIHGVFEEGLFCDPEELAIEDIIGATGGAKLALGTGDVDLSQLNLIDFIKNFWLVDIDSDCVESSDTFVLVLVLTVTEGSDTRTQTFTFTVTLA